MRSRTRNSSDWRPLIFEPNRAVTAGADFFKLKARVIDLYDAVTA
jgi:hypothetical protein